nr:reverse transcriptase domain-containing protein [Tanacetum cinerariifolium]
SEMDDLPRRLADAAECVRDAIGFESHVLWAEIGESSLTGLVLVQETNDKVVLVKEKTKEARDRQKSYVDYSLADANLHVPLDEIEAYKTLHFVEETMGIMDREI